MKANRQKRDKRLIKMQKLFCTYLYLFFVSRQQHESNEYELK